jgi:hypothetical protein
MGGGLGLPCLANKQISLDPVRGVLGFLAQALCVFLEALTEPDADWPQRIAWSGFKQPPTSSTLFTKERAALVLA